ncbi:hypothetical protein JAAARDRAFT_38757 [Jaapia argillacea MUCL 33604]|uniref:Uncharacterized protein n=1 Tax=Jaapia argillacea MUCL 33604 TaxID=933084 RepID=A0A067PJY0_9AGAM|nr:hypothetical protein JAAARDRAFT_38757 [Jaapia argillacea MUCL 33604]
MINRPRPRDVAPSGRLYDVADEHMAPYPYPIGSQQSRPLSRPSSHTLASFLLDHRSFH